MRYASLAVLTSLVVLLPAGSAPASALCGSADGGFENGIVGFHVSCARAKQIARAWHRRSIGKPGSKVVGFYHCQSAGTDPEHVAVICTRVRATSHKVFFFAGP